MFDLTKLKIATIHWQGFNTTASDAEIEELNQCWDGTLPKNHIEILKKYNGGSPELNYFDIGESA